MTALQGRRSPLSPVAVSISLLQKEATERGEPLNSRAIEMDLSILYARFERTVLYDMVEKLSSIGDTIGHNSQRYREHMLAKSIDKHLWLGVLDNPKDR